MTTKKIGSKKQKSSPKTTIHGIAKKSKGKRIATGSPSPAIDPPPADIDPAAMEVQHEANAASVANGEEPRGKHGRKPNRSVSASNGQTSTSSPPAGRDSRLPEPGTILRKLDRHGNVRCECTVEGDGVRYDGTTFRSLSAAAVAAANDLDIKGAQNGYVFWGLVKPTRQPGEAPLVRLQKSWERYASCARAVLATAPEAQRSDVLAAIGRHREVELSAI
jgi:hypothetical protein